MDTIQAILGDVLLVLAGLALILVAVILLLVQANVIVCLGGKLTSSLRSDSRDGAPSSPPAEDRPHANSAPNERGG